MRELSLEEQELIAGGLQTVDAMNQDIVVTADPGDGFFPPIVGDGGGDSGGPGGIGGGEEYAQWQFWGGVAMDFIVSFLSNKASSATERETTISSQFNPSEVVANMQGLDANGNIDRGWRMQDGSAFFDTNGNGKPDLRMWNDDAGNVWADEGAGRTLVRGVG
ncbi:hypothetical protein [Sphingomonas sp.]|uniref:hypothetical protein n=1 Tax=Sphingomonas sp. TaxID=28214 RepID=UPI002BAA3EF6|nr:hypothetical protein [Sphingomonas sp.]HTG37855.1 hypothetical protein [Sphingomonas sp.]